MVWEGQVTMSSLEATSSLSKKRNIRLLQPLSVPLLPSTLLVTHLIAPPIHLLLPPSSANAHRRPPSRRPHRRCRVFAPPSGFEDQPGQQTAQRLGHAGEEGPSEGFTSSGVELLGVERSPTRLFVFEMEETDWFRSSLVEKSPVVLFRNRHWFGSSPDEDEGRREGDRRVFGSQPHVRLDTFTLRYTHTSHGVFQKAMPSTSERESEGLTDLRQPTTRRPQAGDQRRTQSEWIAISETMQRIPFWGVRIPVFRKRKTVPNTNTV